MTAKQADRLLRQRCHGSMRFPCPTSLWEYVRRFGDLEPNELRCHGGLRRIATSSSLGLTSIPISLSETASTLRAQQIQSCLSDLVQSRWGMPLATALRYVSDASSHQHRYPDIMGRVTRSGLPTSSQQCLLGIPSNRPSSGPWL